ncbi:AI-2E family transporter [Marinactinospora thermotolerans]|uniref:Predicted PurR-regulated permease PerM n=1 Tax=Marinactinospora thermotolerans DSM 45154 TaxID=1122192 RepID=A0A1T4JZQ8_9ACTN|nr:AI-2E family transporter [Marinactinospora thermotolerans]SJZ35614.1 Predicted PurR-regulated permease PerM [Marinactinospora thermotolerans DSM 45154]
MTPDRAGQRDGADERLRAAAGVAWRLLVVGAAIAILVWIAIRLRTVVIPIILAVALTALLGPPTAWLRRKGLGRGPATTIVVLGSLVVLGGAITLMIQPALAGSGDLIASVQQGLARVPSALARVGVDQAMFEQLWSRAQQELQQSSGRLVSGAWSSAVAAGQVVIGIVLVAVLTVYFLHSGDRLVQWLLSLFPAASRSSLYSGGTTAYEVLGRYVRGVAIVGLIDAVGIGIFLIFLIDIQLAIPLIVLTFIGAFLPVIGAFLAGLLSALAALVTEGWVIALVVVGVTILVQQLESNLFAPRVYGRSLDLPSPVVLLVITIGSLLGGIAGAFLSTPIAAVVAALLRRSPAEEESAAPKVGAGGGGKVRAPSERGGPVEEAGGASRPAAPPDRG